MIKFRTKTGSNPFNMSLNQSIRVYVDGKIFAKLMRAKDGYESPLTPSSWELVDTIYTNHMNYHMRVQIVQAYIAMHSLCTAVMHGI